MTTTEDEQQLGNSTTGYVPMFSGSKADYDSFKEDIDDWEFSTKIPKETRAARLILVQIEQVKKIMRTVPKEQRRTANGVSLIMKEMDKKNTCSLRRTRQIQNLKCSIPCTASRERLLKASS